MRSGLSWMLIDARIGDRVIDPKTISLWTAALIGVGTILAGAIKFVFYLYDEVRKRASFLGNDFPQETLRIALKGENDYWWHMGGAGNSPAMQVVGDFHVTNISN